MDERHLNPAQWKASALIVAATAIAMAFEMMVIHSIHDRAEPTKVEFGAPMTASIGIDLKYRDHPAHFMVGGTIGANEPVHPFVDRCAEIADSFATRFEQD